MEYVRGTDLRTIVRRAKLRRRELAPGAALHITLEVLAGLAYAHTRKSAEGSSLATAIHRDDKVAVEHPPSARPRAR